MGNQLTLFTIIVCYTLWLHDCYFCIENPEKSFLWCIVASVGLTKLPGVAFQPFTFRDFGAICVKPTFLLHNVPTFFELWSKEDETELTRPVKLRGQVWWEEEGRMVFLTRLAQAYPPSMCAKLATLVSKAKVMWMTAKAEGLQAPMAEPRHDVGNPMQAFIQDDDESDVPDDEEDLSSGDDERPANLDKPFVTDGYGAVRGLAPLEHVQRTKGLQHPMSEVQKPENLPWDFMLPLEFEATHTETEIDFFRQEAFELVERKALELEGERTEWLAGVPVELRPLMSTVHGPLLNWLHEKIESEDKLFPTRMQSGFQLTGELDCCGDYNTTPWQVDVNDEEASLEELAAARYETNLYILGKCEEREHNGDLVTLGEQDCSEGCMTEAIVVDEELTRSVTLSRRIAVRELRSKGWRTRSVDHMSESGLAAATKPKDKIKHQTIDTMVFMILWLQQMLCPDIVMWKRDFRKAFRCIPIMRDHLVYAWVTFKWEGHYRAACHLGCPFGAVASCWNWHRMGNFVEMVLRRLFRVSVMRYVDDLAGVGKRVVWNGGMVLTNLSLLLGIITDPSKDADECMAMTLLGIQISIMRAGALLQLDAEKAARWAIHLEELLDLGTCEAGFASKMAGRLSFAVCTCTDKIGRAYLRPFFQQAVSPRLYITPNFRWACRFFLWYLRMRPPVFKGLSAQRPVHVAWSDASGPDRMICGIVRLASGLYSYYYTEVPERIMEQFNKREDHYIGLLETLALLVTITTFQTELAGGLVLGFVDNQGALHSVLRATSLAAETEIMVAEFWKVCTVAQIGFSGWRVESKANVADGPTRNYFRDVVDELSAQFRQPVFPQFLQDLWRHPVIPEV